LPDGYLSLELNCLAAILAPLVLPDGYSCFARIA
jgi:hypothetical protein